ncbi:MAG: hypothetical protein AB7H77_03630 [Bdellovibrionales bacterium]
MDKVSHMSDAYKRFRALRDRLTDWRDATTAKKSALEKTVDQDSWSVADWDRFYRKQWLEVMVPRVKEYSEQNANSVIIPNPAYHGSPYHGTTEFDPSLGQGLGVWFQPELIGGASFAISRSRHLDSATPVVYEVELKPKRIAIFPTEVDAYVLSIPKEDDDEDFATRNPFSLHEVREILQKEGFDSIYLQDQQTISAIKPDIIKIIAEHRALPIFDEHIRPVKERELGDNFPRVFDYLSKLSR